MDRSQLARWLRNDTFYRSFGPGERESRWGCGFILKPDRGGYTQRITKDYIAVYVLRGTGTFISRSGRHRVGAGCFCQHVPEGEYSLLPDLDGQWAEVFLTMDGPLYMHMADLGAIDARRDVLQPGLAARLVERFEEILRDLRDLPESSLHGSIARYVDLLVQVQRLDRSQREGPDATLVDRACQRLAEDLAERLPLPQLADELGVGYDHFRKVFSAWTGVSPGAYRIRRRIDRARELILHEQMQNKEIADALGYADPFTFSKQFKRMVGESPEAFRRRMFG